MKLPLKYSGTHTLIVCNNNEGKFYILEELNTHYTIVPSLYCAVHYRIWCVHAHAYTHQTVLVYKYMYVRTYKHEPLTLL